MRVVRDAEAGQGPLAGLAGGLADARAHRWRSSSAATSPRSPRRCWPSFLLWLGSGWAPGPTSRRSAVMRSRRNGQAPAAAPPPSAWLLCGPPPRPLWTKVSAAWSDSSHAFASAPSPPHDGAAGPAGDSLRDVDIAGDLPLRWGRLSSSCSAIRSASSGSARRPVLDESPGGLHEHGRPSAYRRLCRTIGSPAALPSCGPATP